MVALEPLVAKGWLAAPVLPEGGFGAARVDYARVTPWRLAQLRAACGRLLRARGAAATARRSRPGAPRRPHWLDDYALFMALETAHAGAAVVALAAAAARARAGGAGRRRGATLAGEIRFWQFVQWCFDTQWAALQGARQRARRVAHRRPADLRRPRQRRLLGPARPVHAGRRRPADGRRRRAARRVQRRRASAGATRCTAGTAWPPRATPGGSPACGARWRRPTRSASTTSAASRRTGRCRRPARPRSTAAGCPAPARRCSTRSRARSARCRSSPRTWA